MNSATAENASGLATSDRLIRILINVLVVTRVILFFTIVTTIATALRVPFFPLRIGGDPADPDAEAPTAYIGSFIVEDMTQGAIYAQASVDLIVIIAGIYVIGQMLGLLRNVIGGHAFVRENGERLRRMGYAGVIAQLSIYAVWIGFQIAAFSDLVDVEGLVMQITPTPWIIILCAFALSTVFRDAAAMKEEQELTV